MATPQTQDAFTRVMAPAFDDRISIPMGTGFQAFFGNPASGGKTLFSGDAGVVDIDIIRGNEKIAALIPRGTVSRPLGSLQSNTQDGKFSTFSRKYPLSEEEGDIDSNMILQRKAGEQPFARSTRVERMRVHGFNIITEHVRRIIRMCEVLAAQSVLTGVQDAIIGTSNADLQYDFHRNAANIITVGTAWSNVAAPIFGDLDNAAGKVRQNGKIPADMVVFGSTAMAGFRKNTQVLAEADNSGYQVVQVSDMGPVPPRFNRFIAGGFVPQGNITTPEGHKLWLFTYTDGGYENSAGTFVNFIGVDQVLITSSEARCDRYFGPPERLPITSMDRELYLETFGISLDIPPAGMVRSEGGIIEPQMFHADAYTSADRKRITVRTQAAPIFATTQTDAFVTLDTTP